MRIIERAFGTLDEAQAFTEGLDLVDRPETIQVYDMLMELKVKHDVGYGIPDHRFVVIMFDPNGDDSASEFVEDEDWQRLYPNYTNQVTIKASARKDDPNAPAALRHRTGLKR